MNQKPLIAGIGEILWDIFPDGGRLGGAPANFACHCRQLGGDAFPVSCVGDDEMGRRTFAQLEQWEVPTAFVKTSEKFPTGQVIVSPDGVGKPSYEILLGVAWDDLTFTDDLSALAPVLDAACFGTLSQRSAGARRTIRQFLQAMRERSVKIFDVNLRAPFFSREIISDSLDLATVLKLSDEELPVLAGYFALKGTPAEQLRTLCQQFRLDLIAYTRGSDGSLLVSADEIDEAPGLEVTAIDSVGAGDSFTAALCTGLLNGLSLSQINTFANRVGAFVCSQKGACPELPKDLRL